MAGKFKSEITPSADFHRKNLEKVDRAVDFAKAQYRAFSSFVMDELKRRGYDQDDKQMLDWLDWLKAFDTVIRAHDQMRSSYHHFQKYHAADSDSFLGGECYLGTQCVSCEYSRSQQRAIDENTELTRGNQ
jgi:hypothetical protein